MAYVSEVIEASSQARIEVTEEARPIEIEVAGRVVSTQLVLGKRVSVGEAVQRASSGRQGRFLGASNRGDTIVVRWEYPGGRVADIMVDARSGRVVGQR